MPLDDLSMPFAQPLLLVSREVTGRNAYGNQVRGDTLTVSAGGIAPTTSTETTFQQDSVSADEMVMLPPGTSLEPVDAIVLNPTIVGGVPQVDENGKALGDWYEIQGVENVWVSPFDGWAPGVTAIVRKVGG